MPDPVPFRLPDLGEGMAEAEIVRWEVGVGDHVVRDQIVVLVQTDKAEVELPSPSAGTIRSLGADVGDIVPIGGTLLELVPDDATESAGAPPTTQPASANHRIGGLATQVGERARVQAAPPVRKLAKELGVDLEQVAGTGPEGRVTAADVRAAVDTSRRTVERVEAPAAIEERRVPLRGIRRAMARNMAEAWRVVPHISLFDEIDARALLDALRAARDLSGSETLTLTAFFVRAAVLALVEQPILNASLDEAADEVVYHDAINIGIAVATDDGLVVPVVHEAQNIALVALADEITRLTAAARAGGLPPEVLRGATFSVTNFGTEGGRFATPIIRPPQVAILGTGVIRARPVVDGDRVVAAPTLPLSLSADHRVVDGHDATRFLEAVAETLREPLGLLAGGH